MAIRISKDRVDLDNTSLKNADMTDVTNTYRTATTTVAGAVEKSTSGENTTGTATDKFPDVAGVKEMIDEHASGIGEGQTWQSPSRSENTSYQNTTGKPIAIIVSVSGEGDSYSVKVSSDNSSWTTVFIRSESNPNETGTDNVCFIVPDTWYYRADEGTFGSNLSWRELR